MKGGCFTLLFLFHEYLYNMKYYNNSFLLNEIKQQLLNEWKSKTDNVAVAIRETLKKVYQGTNFWGKIQNPDKNW